MSALRPRRSLRSSVSFAPSGSSFADLHDTGVTRRDLERAAGALDLERAGLEELRCEGLLRNRSRFASAVRTSCGALVGLIREESLAVGHDRLEHPPAGAVWRWKGNLAEGAVHEW
jgi:hypothetical protein